MNDDVRLFESRLSELDAAPQMVPGPDRHHFPEESAVRADLHLVRAMRHIQVPEGELLAAHTRVARLLQAEMDAGETATVPVRAARPNEHTSQSTVAHRRPAYMRRLAQAALVAAAILLVGGLVGWQVSEAAASALPGSPLYGIKRAEESLALQLTGSDTQRGEVLATIADHRLTEIRAEAEQHNDPLVKSLAREFDGTMRQLIALTATMTRQHENTTDVTARLVHELAVEYSTLRTAQQRGDVVLAQALTVTTQAEDSAIHDSHITLPPGAVNTPVPVESSPGATPPGGQPARGSPSAIPTHVPPAPPGNGGNDQGGGTPGPGGENGGKTGTPASSSTSTLGSPQLAGGINLR
ncbi:MAG TPA: DUF5667 domain-containing protein [Ktedonobacterales bacterium]|nr:DUF5667 domain-containing protein [Ktedonobacterales bacterium]